MLTHASADGPGNLVVLYGSATGRDGIGGASVLASATFGDQDPSKRPSVQVGDPFAEKLLIEATLELIAKGLVVSIQDLGAAGITCATCETADRGGTGMLVDLDAIPRREPGMEPFEVMISESQERMVAIVEPGRWEAVRAVCERWDLPVAVIGRVTEEQDIVVLTGPGRRAAPSIPTADRSPACRSSPGSRPARSRPRRSCSSARRVRLPAVGPHQRRAPPRSRSTRCRSGARTRARCSPPSSGRRTSRRGARCSSSTTGTCSPTPWPGPGAAPPCSGSRGRRRRSSPRPTATPPSASTTRGSAPRCPWPRPPATCRSPARGRWA